MKLQIIRTQGGFKNRTIDYPGNLYLPSYIKIKKIIKYYLKNFSHDCINNTFRAVNDGWLQTRAKIDIKG